MWLCADQRASHVTPWELSQQSATDCLGHQAFISQGSGDWPAKMKARRSLIGLLGRACILDADILLCGERH